MRKIVLFISTLLFSYSVIAAGVPHNLGTDMLIAMQKKVNAKTTRTMVSADPIIYGGQDISRKKVATANESVWNGQPILVG